MPAKRRLLCKRNRGPHTAGNAWTFCPLLFCMQRSGSVGCRCTTISRQELQVAALRDAFMNGRERARARSKTADGPQAEHPASTFGDGAEWIRQVLVPAIDRGNAELQPLHIAFQLDLNLDPRSTNHAHADFWLSELGEGQRAVGPKYSVNVLGGKNVWLYKPGAPGRDLGTRDRCGPDAIQTLLQDAAQEFGGMAR